MIRIAICDDDVSVLENVFQRVQAFTSAHPEQEFSVRRFHSVYDLLECLETGRMSFNIYLLDIVMPMFNGIEVGQMIRKRDKFAVIIYMTVSEDFALEAYRNSPLFYLLKPIEDKSFRKCMEDAYEKISQVENRNLLVHVREGIANIRLHQILYVEYRKHALLFHLLSGQILTSVVMRTSFISFMENYLDDARFIKTHAAYVVNMDHVSILSANEFKMLNGECLPISKRAYPQVKRSYMEYMLRQQNAYCSPQS